MLIEQRKRTADEVVRLGSERLVQQIAPTLAAADAGRFVCIDIDTGAYEISDDDLTAVNLLLARSPGAETYLGRVGEDATFRLGLR